MGSIWGSRVGPKLLGSRGSAEKRSVEKGSTERRAERGAAQKGNPARKRERGKWERGKGEAERTVWNEIHLAKKRNTTWHRMVGNT